MSPDDVKAIREILEGDPVDGIDDPWEALGEVREYLIKQCPHSRGAETNAETGAGPFCVDCGDHETDLRVARG